MNCPKCNNLARRTVGDNYKCITGCKISFNQGKQWPTGGKKPKATPIQPAVQPKLVSEDLQLTEVIIVRDHSGSMDQSGKATAAMKSFNSLLDEFKRQCHERTNHRLTVTTIEFAPVIIVGRSQDPRGMQPLTSYRANTSTPLHEALGLALDHGEEVQRTNPAIAVFVYAFTDGANTEDHRYWNPVTLERKVREKVAKGDWTITMMAAEHHAIVLAKQIGIPEGNIKSCENSGRGISAGAQEVLQATSILMTERAKGTTRGSTTFFVGAAEGADPVAAGLVDATSDFHSWTIDKSIDIADFVKGKGFDYAAGSCFYELTKDEKAVQGYKSVVVRNNKTGRVYVDRSSESAPAVRRFVGLPTDGSSAKAKPANNNADYDVFVQSKSYNRDLVKGTRLLHVK